MNKDITCDCNNYAKNRKISQASYLGASIFTRWDLERIFS